MSCWITRRSKEGGRDLDLIDVPLLLLVMLFGLLLSFLLPIASALRQTARSEPEGLILAAIGFMVMGFFCLVTAKVSLFRRGIWISWGPRLMTRLNTRLYGAGYAMIGVGMGLLLFIVLAV